MGAPTVRQSPRMQAFIDNARSFLAGRHDDQAAAGSAVCNQDGAPDAHWVGDVVVVVTACSDAGTAARAGSVFIAIWSSVMAPAFNQQSIESPAPVWESCVFARTT